MPRLPRIRVEGAIYYVTSRAAQNEVIFKDKEDYKMYLELVNKYKTQHKFKLYSYSLLPGRLELLVETEDATSISEIMHDLNSTYTKYFNGRYQRRGHLFESRFRSVLVEKVQYLLAMTRQIHLAAPADPAYSSYHLYLYKGDTAPYGPDLKAEIQEVMDFLRTKDDTASYEKYVMDGDTKEIEALEKSLRRGQVLGSEEFRNRVKETVQKYADEKEEATPKKTSPVSLFFIGGLVVLATASTVYLYISKNTIESKYVALLMQKEQEFSEKTKFENLSPIALNDLDGTVWKIERVSLPASSAKETIPDTLHFLNGKFFSEEYVRAGFAPTNFTRTVQPNGLTTWETLQSNAAGDTVSWRGDWQGDVMKGVVSYKPASGPAQDFSFFSTGWSYAAEGGAQ